jgi:hypothetical protein
MNETTHADFDPNILAALEGAQITGEAVEIRYMGGSQPGSLRQIFPLSINGDRVRARCLATNVVKTFSMKKMLPPEGNLPPAYSAPKKSKSVKLKAQTIEELHAETADRLTQLGWYVRTEQDSLFLSTYFKNGKPKRTPIIELSYCEFVETDEWLPGNETPEIRKSTRPYRLRVKGENTRAFAKFSSAAANFMKAANQSPEQY